LRSRVIPDVGFYLKLKSLSVDRVRLLVRDKAVWVCTYLKGSLAQANAGAQVQEDLLHIQAAELVRAKR
jgi:hypothetical protein